MKKFTKILALTLVLMMSVALFASCAAPNKDPEKAKEALEKAEYEVIYADEELAELAAGMLGVEKVTALISASKGDDAIEIFYFEDAAAANDAFDTVKEMAEKAGTTAEVKKSGNMIYYGTPAAIKAAK